MCNSKTPNNTILGIVVIFNPDMEDLIENIRSYIGDLNLLIIWRNSTLSSNEMGKYLSNEEISKIVYAGDETNRGIPAALNYATDFAAQNGYRYILSMDQDSKWVNFRDFSEYIVNLEDANSIYGPRVVSVGDNENIPCEDDNNLIEVDYVITSGTFCTAELLKKIGPVPEEYFIDAVDEEMCFRAKKIGVRVCKVTKGALLQNFGAHTQKKFFGKTVVVQNYSAFRYYYIVRNHIWLIRSNLVSSKMARSIRHNYVIMPFIKVTLFEKNKIRKLARMVNGLIDGYRDMRGK